MVTWLNLWVKYLLMVIRFQDLVPASALGIGELKLAQLSFSGFSCLSFTEIAQFG